MPCAICHTAKPRRFCPGVHDNICAACCGISREETVDCPLTCEYLAEAHRHEKKIGNPTETPSADVHIDDEFLHTHEFLVVLIGSSLFEGAQKHPNALDADARAALDSLVETSRAAGSGLIYDKSPVNPIAASMTDAVKVRIDDIRRRMKEAEADITLPDDAVLKVLVFLQRIAFGVNNGRSKCKAFLVFLSQFYVDMKKDEAVTAEQPQVVL